MNKRNDFDDDRSRDSHKDGSTGQYDDKAGSTKSDYGWKEDGSSSEMPPGEAHRQQQEDTGETSRIERLKKD